MEPASNTAEAVTQILLKCTDGDQNALEALFPIVYRELRRLAGGMMKSEKSNHTLQPTALVHEAYFRLVDQSRIEWKNRAQFFGVAAQMMRRVLVDHARARSAEKRGSGGAKIEFDEALHTPDSVDLVEVDRALIALAAIDERQAKVVELRYFGGLSVEETAEVMETSPATVKRDWALAKAWLFRELSGSGSD